MRGKTNVALETNNKAGGFPGSVTQKKEFPEKNKVIIKM
jgi:hypothetical protein